MKQPDLGRKISQLRKEKGLTQEELVEKCEISIRTLQRIESGEVTPRSYTLKTILKQLESENSIEFEKKEIENLSWLEQLKTYVIELFNLKTKTMKKILILTAIFTGILFVSFATTKENKKKEKEEFTKREIVFSDFYCENCFEENHELFGHGVSFKTNGVKIKIDLIKINKQTGQFNCGLIKGKLLENRLEITCPKEFANDESVLLNAKDIKRKKDRIELIGEASIKSNQGDYFEANEILIFFE
jgi:transcriptional regulator with XRE-family HTH domain